MRLLSVSPRGGLEGLLLLTSVREWWEERKGCRRGVEKGREKEDEREREGEEAVIRGSITKVFECRCCCC